MKNKYIAFGFFIFSFCTRFLLASPADNNQVLTPDQYIKISKIAQTIIINENISIKESQLLSLENHSWRNPKDKKSNEKSRYLERIQRREKRVHILKELDHLYAQLALVEANDLNEILLPFDYDMQIGQIGRTRGRDTKNQSMVIRDIVDANNCRVIFRLDYYDRKVTERIVWLRGVSTENLADGSEINPPAFLRITGVQDYRTPLGDKRTVFVFEPFQPP